MGGTNKNIRSRQAMLKVAQTIHQPFTTLDMSVLCKQGLRRVAALLAIMPEFTKEDTQGRPKYVWRYKPKEN